MYVSSPWTATGFWIIPEQGGTVFLIGLTWLASAYLLPVGSDAGGTAQLAHREPLWDRS